MAREPDNIPESDRADGCPHPRATYDLIGHQAAESRFLSAKNSGRLHHAWLISGPKGVGKATLAYRIIRHILGGVSLLADSLDIPATDPAAQRIESLGHGDLFILRRPYDVKTKKLRSEIPVSETRRLRDFFAQKPSEGGWRVCLIDSADELNRNAENGILKTLEEPPDKAIIIMLANMPGRLLPTIESRCIHLPLRGVRDTEIIPWLRSRNLDQPANILETAVKLSRGAPGKAFALSQNADNVLKPLSKILKSFDDQDPSYDHQISNLLSLANAAYSRHLFWDALQDILQAQSVFTATGQWNSAFQPLSITKSSEAWRKLWLRVQHLREREEALNMDKKTVMLTMLSDIRAA